MQCREAFCALEFYSDEHICNAWIQVSFHKYTLFIMYTINTIGTWRYWQPLIPRNIITSTSLMFIPRTLPRCSLLRRPSPSVPSDGSTQACGPSPQSLSRGCTELQCAPLYRLLPPGMCHPLPDISLYWKINMFQAEQSAPFHPFIDLLAASDVCLSVRQYSADPLNEINCIARMSRGNPYISAVSINFSSEQLSFS